MRKFTILLFVLSLSASCAGNGSISTTETAQELTPTPTEAPMAARVNGEGILLSDYEQELQRYQAAAAELQMETSEQEARDQVLKFLIEQTLFKQAAEENGYTVSETALTQKMDELAQLRGGQAELDAYLSANFYTLESFRRTIARDMAVMWMRNTLIDQAGTTTEQVHARQILVDTRNEATAVLRRLEVGTSFKELAFEYDPLTGGELGWFPRGYLYKPAVEEAAFALQPGEHSGMIETDYGFHIVEVIERDPQRELKADALIAFQRQAVHNWLEEYKTQSSIETLVN